MRTDALTDNERKLRAYLLSLYRTSPEGPLRARIHQVLCETHRPGLRVHALDLSAEVSGTLVERDGSVWIVRGDNGALVRWSEGTFEDAPPRPEGPDAWLNWPIACASAPEANVCVPHGRFDCPSCIEQPDGRVSAGPQPQRSALPVPLGLKWHREDPDGGWELVFVDDERSPRYDGQPYYYAVGDTKVQCLKDALQRRANEASASCASCSYLKAAIEDLATKYREAAEKLPNMSDTFETYGQFVEELHGLTLPVRHVTSRRRDANELPVDWHRDEQGFESSMGCFVHAHEDDIVMGHAEGDSFCVPRAVLLAALGEPVADPLAESPQAEKETYRLLGLMFTCPFCNGARRSLQIVEHAWMCHRCHAEKTPEGRAALLYLTPGDITTVPSRLQIHAITASVHDDDVPPGYVIKKLDATTGAGARPERWIVFPEAWHYEHIERALAIREARLHAAAAGRRGQRDLETYARAAENALRRIASACSFVRSHDYPLQVVSDVEQRLDELAKADAKIAELTDEIARLRGGTKT